MNIKDRATPSKSIIFSRKKYPFQLNLSHCSSAHYARLHGNKQFQILEISGLYLFDCNNFGMTCSVFTSIGSVMTSRNNFPVVDKYAAYGHFTAIQSNLSLSECFFKIFFH
eukprot:NODE_27_length_39007_cov_1.590650.p33 type:complete len:111 gc:universal NODE_27_length_39007_cov_1.590650:4275-4607(+)